MNKSHISLSNCWFFIYYASDLRMSYRWRAYLSSRIVLLSAVKCEKIMLLNWKCNSYWSSNCSLSYSSTTFADHDWYWNTNFYRRLMTKIHKDVRSFPRMRVRFIYRTSNSASFFFLFIRLWNRFICEYYFCKLWDNAIIEFVINIA